MIFWIMSKKEIEQIRNKIFKGLKKAREKAKEDSIKFNSPLVVSENGKIKLVYPEQ